MRFIVALVVNLIFVVLLPLRLLRSAFAAPRGGWIEIVVDGSVLELRRPESMWRRRTKALALESLRDVVAVAGKDSRLRGLLVRIKSFAGGSARATSLREVLSSARAAGLEVVVYLPHGGGTQSMFIASVADRIFVGPESQLDLTGFAIEVNYLRGVLDRLGIEPEVFARGRYKTAGEFLEKKSMSEPQREQLDRLLDVAHDVLIGALAEGRGVDRQRASQWLDEAPLTAAVAQKSSLVDGVAYDDELLRALDGKPERDARLISAWRYVARRRVRAMSFSRRRYLAVVDVAGPIVSEAPFSLVPVALEDSVCRALRAAGEDPRAIGLIVNISSRGGSALASDRMLHEVRRVAEKKPVVAYLGDVAASGGYMIAVGAHAIVAQPTTVTGSIGVVAARLVLQPLLGKIGVVTEVVKRGPRADMASMARSLTAAERSHLERHLDEIYESFIAAVARGRGKSVEEIEPLAGGRVYSGREAREVGLVDQLGGFDVALAELRRRIGPAAEGAQARAVRVGSMRAPGLLTRYLQASGRPGAAAELAELGALALSGSRDKAWLWSEVSELGEA